MEAGTSLLQASRSALVEARKTLPGPPWCVSHTAQRRDKT